MTTEQADTHQDVDPAPVPEPQQPSPGQLIREARERARMSLDDMSAHTKLARSTLEALERDDHRALLEPVYVRGYYRKCAKVLEIDEDRLIAPYNARVAPRSPEAPAKLRLASGTELGSSSRLPVSMAVLAAVVAVVVCAFIWFAREPGQNYPVSAIVETIPLEPVAQATPDPAALPAAAPAETVAVEPVEPTPTPTPAVAAAAGSLRLRFVQTSWARIDDAGGKTLLNGMRAAGEVDALVGQPPLSVFLGNAPGVEIEFEGVQIDVAPYVRDNKTARFTLPLN